MANIRPTELNDLEAINQLFAHPVDIDYLKWSLTDPSHPSFFRSFVATNSDNQVIGHIAYTASNWYWQNSHYIAIHPLSWYVASKAKGANSLVGLSLMSQILNLGDVCFIIGGTQQAHKIYPSFKLDFKMGIPEFFKLLAPVKHIQLQQGSYLKRIIKTLILSRSIIGKTPAGIPVLQLEPLSSISSADISAQKVLYHDLSSQDFKWFLNCPILESFAFQIIHKEQSLGFVLCYISLKNGIPVGRIVHLSYLSESSGLWSAVVHKLEDIFKQKGCAYISVLALYSQFQKALKNNGFINSGSRPLFLRDPNNQFAALSNDSWHLTFLEGDLAPRF